MSAVLYLPYLPNINWLQSFVKQQPVVIEQWENFVKSTYRNRCHIAGANGLQMLSIPLAGGRDHHRLYKDVRISNTGNWQQKHWQSIISAYGSAPFFEHYADRLQPLYEKQYEFLFDFNYGLLKVVLAMLKVNSPAELTAEYIPTYDDKADLRRREDTCEVIYYQVFAGRNGFIPNLCALDLIFNEGPAARKIISG